MKCFQIMSGMELTLQDKLVCLKGNDTIDLFDTVQTILKL